MSEKSVKPSDMSAASVQLLGDIRKMIEETRGTVAVTVNAGLTMLYWRIGMRINKEIFKRKRANYGKQIIATLSQELSWSHFRELLHLDKPLQSNFYDPYLLYFRGLKDAFQEKDLEAVEHKKLTDPKKSNSRKRKGGK